jgi:DUF1009 family protein
MNESEMLNTASAPDSSAKQRKIALVAGQGDFPLLIARAAKANGTELFALCINGFTSPELPALTRDSYWMELGQLGKAFETLKSHGITHVMMAGRIPHNTIFQYRHFDWRAMKMLAKAASKRADALLAMVCEEFAAEGITVMESSAFLRDLMPQPGLLTPGRPLATREEQDVEFGFPIAKIVAGQDIGQTIVVKDRMVAAVEGLEGTDECVKRAGELAGPGCVVIKVSKPAQDLRFDIPIVGPGTIKSMIKAGATALALSSGRSLIFHREQVITMAEEADIAIMILNDDEPVVSDTAK